MNPAPLLILLIVITLPIAWFSSEFSPKRWLRLTLGIGALLSSFGVAYLAGSLEMFSANAWFGSATKALVDTTVTELERGNTQQVLMSLKQLQEQYHPNYEQRSRYDVLVEEAVQRMKAPPSTSPQ